MIKSTGTADLPLHYGKVPAWLYDRMFRMSREIVRAIVDAYGTGEFITRMSHPFWFQSLGAVLGMDWHSSGITSSVTAALKRAINPFSFELGLYVCGGKGRYSRQTPEELARVGEKTGLEAGKLIRTSRLVARVDNNAVQDGYQLYIHCMVVDRDGHWSIIQQGKNTAEGLARRYHWLSEGLRSFTEEPHAAVCGRNHGSLLNLTDREASATRTRILEMVKEPPDKLMSLLNRLIMPVNHGIKSGDLDLKRLAAVLALAHEQQPEGFEDLLLLEKTGPRTLRALTLLSELVHGTPSRFRDPARYSFACGGKDGHPYPVQTHVYDESIRFLTGAVSHARVGLRDKQDAFRKLSQMSRELEEDIIPSANRFQSFVRKEKMESNRVGGRTVKPMMQLALF